MRKKFFKTLSALAIAAVLALNVTVVLDDNAASYLKFDTLGKILAQTTTSGSGSGSGSTKYKTPGQEGAKMPKAQSTTDNTKFACLGTQSADC